MEVYRIHNRAFAALDGTGAAMHGARWNPPGTTVIYAAATFEGAILEQLVNAGIGRLPKNRVVSKIVIPDVLVIETLDEVRDEAWNEEVLTQAIGVEWIEAAGSVALLVPSAVARPYGQNVLINPRHPDFSSVEVAETLPVVWDPRLLHGPADTSPTPPARTSDSAPAPT